MLSDPLVTVVIPTYNNARLVSEAIESVLRQSYRRLEVIVVDDGSTDDTRQVLAAFPPPVHALFQEHRGPAAARNAGIRAGSGELVAFLDSDDIWMPEKLAKSIAPLLSRPEVGVVYTRFQMHDLSSGLRYRVPMYTHSGWMAQDIFLECRGVSTSTIVCRRSCLEEVGLFDEELFRAQDWDMFIRLAEKFQFHFVPEVLTERRIHGGNLSVVHRDLYREYNLRVIEKAVRRRPELYGPLQKEALSRAYCRFGLESYRTYDMPAARRDFISSLRYKPNWRAANYLLRSFMPKKLIRWWRARQESKLRGETPHLEAR